MHVLGSLEAQVVEELEVLGEGGEPLLAADDEVGAHEVIVYGVGEVVGGDAVGLQKYEVLIVDGHFQLAAHQILEGDLLLAVTVGQQAQNPRIARGQIGLHVGHGELAVGQHLGLAGGGLGLPVHVLDFGLLVGCLQGIQLLLGGEHGVSLALGHQLLGEDVVEVGAETLLVGAVVTDIRHLAVGAQDSALVEVDAVALQGGDETLGGTGHLALSVGVLDTEVEHAARLVSQALAHHDGEQTAEVDKSRGGGGEASHFGALGKAAGGESCLALLGGLGDVGEEQVG